MMEHCAVCTGDEGSRHTAHLCDSRGQDVCQEKKEKKKERETTNQNQAREAVGANRRMSTLKVQEARSRAGRGASCLKCRVSLSLHADKNTVLLLRTEPETGNQKEKYKKTKKS